MSAIHVTVNWDETDLEKVSSAEGLSMDKMRRLLETGRVVIPRNAKRAGNRDIALKAIGERMSTKVNVNVGTSKDYLNLEDEVEKAKIAVKYGADAIMDLRKWMYRLERCQSTKRV
jgi:phosphomethylpyrimidine synthase